MSPCNDFEHLVCCSALLPRKTLGSKFYWVCVVSTRALKVEYCTNVHTYIGISISLKFCSMTAHGTYVHLFVSRVRFIHEFDTMQEYQEGVCVCVCVICVHVCTCMCLHMHVHSNM